MACQVHNLDTNDYVIQKIPSDNVASADDFSSPIFLFLSLLSFLWLIDSTWKYALIHYYASSLTPVYCNFQVSHEFICFNIS